MMKQKNVEDADAVSLNLVTTPDIKELILTVRGKQILLDSDVAQLYGYETMRINETANRNSKRFPPEFRFQLTDDEYSSILKSQSATSRLTTNNLISQNTISSSGEKLRHGGRRKLPYVYTEQGIGMLSGLLKNDTAVQVSIGIMNAFVEMRQFINANGDVFARLVNIDNKLVEHDTKFDEVFDLLQAPETPMQSIFYRGQFYDAFALIVEIIQKAKTQLVIIDNYLDNSVLEMLTNKADGVKVVFITSNPSKLNRQHLERFEKQYGSAPVIESRDFHDRFIIVDDKEAYAIGASLKDVGKKCFEVSKNEDTERFLDYVNRIIDDLNL